MIVDPIDHHHPQIQVAQGAGQAAGQLLLTEGDEAPRHGTARRRPRGERVGDWLQGRPVFPGRHPRDDSPPGLRVERVPFGGPQEAGQGELAAIDGGRPQPSYANPAAAQGDLARGRSSAPGLARRLARPLGAAQLRAVLLHQRVQRLLAHAEAQLEEPLSHRSQPTEHRQRQLDGDLRLTRRLTYGTLLHGGSFSFRIFTSPRLPQPGQGRNRRSTSYFQQPVGHPPGIRLPGQLLSLPGAVAVQPKGRTTMSRGPRPLYPCQSLKPEAWRAKLAYTPTVSPFFFPPSPWIWRRPLSTGVSSFRTCWR